MSLMKTLFEQFQEEIDGVEEYTKCSMAHSDDPELAKMYKDMAGMELQHATSLRAQILKRGEKEMGPGDAEKALKQIWADKKDEMAEDMAKATAYIGMLK